MRRIKQRIQKPKTRLPCRQQPIINECHDGGKHRRGGARSINEHRLALPDHRKVYPQGRYVGKATPTSIVQARVGRPERLEEGGDLSELVSGRSKVPRKSASGGVAVA